MQINITIAVFRLLGFVKLFRKNHAAKNLRRNGAIAKSQIQRRSALFIEQNCATKDSRRNCEANIKHGFLVQRRNRKAQVSHNYRAKPRCKRICGAVAHREVPNSVKVSIIYCAKLRCKEFAAQRRNRKANIKHKAATITGKKLRCKEFSAQRRNREA